MKLIGIFTAAIFFVSCFHKANTAEPASRLEASVDCETALASGATLSLNVTNDRLTILQQVPQRTLVAPIRIGLEPSTSSAYPAGKTDFYCEKRAFSGSRTAFDVTPGFLKISQYPVLGAPSYRFYRFR
jgi:hypothetical protein